MDYSEKDLVLKEKDGTIKVAAIGVTAEQFKSAILNIHPPKETILERGISIIGKMGIGKEYTSLSDNKKSFPIILVDSVVCKPEKQNIIAHTTLHQLKEVVNRNQSELLLIECAEEYLRLMQRSHPEYIKPIALHAPPLFDEPIIVNGENRGGISKHRNNKWQSPAKKKHKKKHQKKQRSANRK